VTRPLGTVASSPIGTSIKVAPHGAAMRGIWSGMELCFVSPSGHHRPGYATVERVDDHTGEVHFTSMLNCSIPAIAEGDEIYEYEQPCTRCRCKRCTAARVYGP
jgi:hypothetical protein